MTTQATQLRRWGLLLVALLLVIWGATEWIVLPWSVVGESMLPTLSPGDRVLVDRWTYRYRAPRPGEVVVLRDAGGRTLVKRVHPGGDDEAVWVLGDNPESSADSRTFGSVPLPQVRGRVIYRYWPLRRAGPVRGSTTLRLPVR